MWRVDIVEIDFNSECSDPRIFRVKYFKNKEIAEHYVKAYNKIECATRNTIIALSPKYVR